MPRKKITRTPVKQLTPAEQQAAQAGLAEAVMDMADASDTEAFNQLVTQLPNVPETNAAFVQGVVAIGFEHHNKKLVSCVELGDTVRVARYEAEAQRRWDLLTQAMGEEYTRGVQEVLRQRQESAASA